MDTTTAHAVRNEVRLAGVLPADPEVRVLPSGDELVVFRVAVPREVPPGSRRVTDSLECVAREGRTRRTVSAWNAGDAVEVSGTLHRRFFRGGDGPASRVEVEVSSARRQRRAPA
ncbi:MAG: single-stranded DNA-binding protein [Nocardioides sp.]|nr:single-stranded DNA-binding protein [Nocardioides sp.]